MGFLTHGEAPRFEKSGRRVEIRAYFGG